MKKFLLFSFLCSVFAEMVQQGYHQNFNENNSSQKYFINQKPEYKNKLLDNIIQPTETGYLEKNETYEIENFQKQISDTQYVKDLIKKKKKEDIPIYWNWRHKGIIQKIKSQDQGNTCWAFAGISNVESHFALKKGVLYDLSEQEIIDCYGKKDHDRHVYDYIRKKKSVYKQDQYEKYSGVKGKCQKGRGDPVRITRLEYKLLYNVDEELLKDFIYLYGPVATGIFSGGIQIKVSKNKDGIIIPDSEICKNDEDHAVNIIGYGTGEKTGVKYWLVRNSWGDSFEDKGYFKIIRGQKACHITEEITYISSIEGEYFHELGFERVLNIGIFSILAAPPSALVITILTMIFKCCWDC